MFQEKSGKKWPTHLIRAVRTCPPPPEAFVSSTTPEMMIMITYSSPSSQRLSTEADRSPRRVGSLPHESGSGLLSGPAKTVVVMDIQASVRPQSGPCAVRPVHDWTLG